MDVFDVGDIRVHRFVWEVFDSNSYVIVGNSSLFVVDPVDSSELYTFLDAQNVGETTVAITHCHFDHICGLNWLRDNLCNVRVVASASCSKRMQSQKLNLSNIADVVMEFGESNSVGTGAHVDPFVVGEADLELGEDCSFKWESHEIVAMSFCGHSDDGLVYSFGHEILFTGDTILPIPTITRLPKGSSRLFWSKDIPRLRELALHTRMAFPGHRMPGELSSMIAVNVEGSNKRRNGSSYVGGVHVG